MILRVPASTMTRFLFTTAKRYFLYFGTSITCTVSGRTPPTTTSSSSVTDGAGCSMAQVSTSGSTTTSWAKLNPGISATAATDAEAIRNFRIARSNLVWPLLSPDKLSAAGKFQIPQCRDAHYVSPSPHALAWEKVIRGEGGERKRLPLIGDLADEGEV